LATDRLERHRAFPGSGNALYGDFLENHFYRERGCLNDHSFIPTKIFPEPTDGCSLQVNHTRFCSGSSIASHLGAITGTTPLATSCSLRSMMGFKDFRCAHIILSGIELMHMIRKGQMKTAKGTSPSAAEQFYSLVM
jgi:hypothetical protein